MCLHTTLRIRIHRRVIIGECSKRDIITIEVVRMFHGYIYHYLDILRHAEPR